MYTCIPAKSATRLCIPASRFLGAVGVPSPSLLLLGLLLLRNFKRRNSKRAHPLGRSTGFSLRLAPTGGGLQFYTILYYTILYYTILSDTIIYRTILYYKKTIFNILYSEPAPPWPSASWPAVPPCGGSPPPSPSPSWNNMYIYIYIYIYMCA